MLRYSSTGHALSMSSLFFLIISLYSATEFRLEATRSRVVNSGDFLNVFIRAYLKEKYIFNMISE